MAPADPGHLRQLEEGLGCQDDRSSLGLEGWALLEGTAAGSPAKTASPPTRPSQRDRDGSPGESRPRACEPACHGSGPRQCRRLPPAEAGTRLSTQRYEQRLTQTFLDQLLPPDCRHTRNTDEPNTWLRSPLTVAVLPVAGMRSKTATRWRRTGSNRDPSPLPTSIPAAQSHYCGPGWT